MGKGMVRGYGAEGRVLPCRLGLGVRPPGLPPATFPATFPARFRRAFFVPFSRLCGLGLVSPVFFLLFLMFHRKSGC